MGCVNSKVSISRRHKHIVSISPRRRSVTLYPSYHFEDVRNVATATAARASASEARPPQRIDVEEEEHKDAQIVCEKSSVEVINEAKIWSGLIDDKIPKIVPKTPISTSSGEPENINLWEVMEGLEDTSPLIKTDVTHCKSFSFDIFRSPVTDNDRPESIFAEGDNFLHDTGQFAQSGFSGPEEDEAETGLIRTEFEKELTPEFDPEIISMFRKSIENPSPENRFSKTLQSSKNERAIIYFTSLRGIRKTYEDCCHIRVILKGLKIRVEEKDLSMHSGFKEELKELLGESYNGGELPKIFIGKKYIGGADEIRRFNEEGELERIFKGCEMIDFNGYGSNTSCEGCGDIRFIPCETCSGSCKIFHKYDEDEEKGLEDDGFGFYRCPDCNENGLIRCPLCCD